MLPHGIDHPSAGPEPVLQHRPSTPRLRLDTRSVLFRPLSSTSPSSSPHPRDHLKYAPTWIGLGVLRLLALLPVPALGYLGDLLGSLLWLILPGRRHIARTNIRLAFPSYTAKEQRRLVRAHFRSAARGMLEGSLAWWAPTEKISPRYTIEGLPHLEAARAQGRGVILLMPHYTTMEMCCRIIVLHVPDFYPIYKPTKDPVFNAAMQHQRLRAGTAGLLANADMRSILQVLRRGHVVWYAPDQDFGRKGCVFVPFMGVATSTLTMTARLAGTSGAPVVPLHCQRLPGNRWHARLEPALEGFPSGDPETDAARINHVIEAQVQRTPEQYLWLHRRFKTRPDPREPNPYRKR